MLIEPGMWPAANSWASRTSRTAIASPSARRSPRSSASTVSIRRTGRPSERQAVIPPPRKPRTLQSDRGEKVGRLELVAIGGGDDDQLDLGRDHPGDLGGEAGVVGGGADRAGDVSLVELVVGAGVDQQGALGDRDLDRPRARAVPGGELFDQRAAVELDDVLDVRRAVAEGGDRVVGELGLASRS